MAPTSAGGLSVRKLQSQLQGDIAAVLDRALHPDPARRYESVAQLVDELRRWQRDMPVMAQRDTLWYRGRKFVRRHALAVGASGIAAFALVAALGISVVQTRAATAQLERAVAVSAFLQEPVAFARRAVPAGWSRHPPTSSTMCCRRFRSASGCCRSPGRSGFCCRPARRCATPGVTRVLAIVVRAIESSLIRRAGMTRKGGASGGVVTLIQRFGGAVNLNLHLHMVALDGVYAKDGETLRFHEVSAPSGAEMQRLLDAIVSRVLRCLEHDGLLIRAPEQPWLDRDSRDTLDALGAASMQYRIAVGLHAGRKALTLKRAAAAAPKSPSTVPKPFTVARDGFSLNAGGARSACGLRHTSARASSGCADTSPVRVRGQRSRSNGSARTRSGRWSTSCRRRTVPSGRGTTHFVFEPLEFTTYIHVRGPSGSLRLCNSAFLPICPVPAGGAGAAATRQPGPLPRDRHDCGRRTRGIEARWCRAHQRATPGA